jgi:hypothetical protein
MKKLIVLMSGLALFSGCGAASLSDFRAGVPGANGVQVKVPDSTNKQVGQTAFWYAITYGGTSLINGSVVAVLNLLHDIVSQQPTSHSGKTYVWGPGAANPLEPNVWKLTVTDNGDGSYSYNLDGKQKGAADSAFVTVLSGTHTPVKKAGVNDPGHGHGTFLLDWDKRNTLTQLDAKAPTGTADVTYAHDTDDVKVDVVFKGLTNDKGQKTDANYHYTQPAGQDGTFQFSTAGDVEATADGNLENLAIESRWKQDGSGRSDVKVSGGDLNTDTVSVSECWDTNFKETYYHDENTKDPSFHFVQDEGQSSDCTLGSAEFYDGN